MPSGGKGERARRGTNSNGLLGIGLDDIVLVDGELLIRVEGHQDNAGEGVDDLVAVSDLDVMEDPGLMKIAQCRQVIYRLQNGAGDPARWEVGGGR